MPICRCRYLVNLIIGGTALAPPFPSICAIRCTPISLRFEIISWINPHERAGRREYQTPIDRVQPEGDFLVPSRLHPGKFYALPKRAAFKQLLMVAVLTVQIAPANDEDARADGCQVSLQLGWK